MVGGIVYAVVRIYLRLRGVAISKGVKSQSIHVRCENKGTLKLSDGVRVDRGNRIVALSRTCLTIGRNSTMNRNNQIYGDVSIGAYCVLASNIFLSSRSHNYRRSFDPIQVQDADYRQSRLIVIENDVWIGVNVFIARGVFIAKGVVLSANSTVVNDITEPFSIFKNGNIDSTLEGRVESIWRWVLRGGKFLNEFEFDTDGFAILYLPKGSSVKLMFNKISDVRIYSEIYLEGYTYQDLDRSLYHIPHDFNYNLIVIKGHAQVYRLFD